MGIERTLITVATRLLLNSQPIMSAVPHSYSWSHQIHQAASEGNIRQLQHLLVEDNSPNTRGGVSCWLRGASQFLTRTPLHYAAKEGHLECIRLLLINGADPNIKDEDGYTPLHYSCQVFKPSADQHDKLRKCVESLIEFGGDVQAETNSQHTPATLARVQNNDACYQQIANHSKTFVCIDLKLL